MCHTESNSPGVSFKFWDLCFTVTISLAAPEPLFPAKALLFNGLAKYLGAGWCRIVVSYCYSSILTSDEGKFQASAMWWCATACVVAQDYCLFYRLTVILMDNERWHRRFLSLPGRVLSHVCMLTCVLTVSILFYYSLATGTDTEILVSHGFTHSEALGIISEHSDPGPIVIIYLDSSLDWAKSAMAAVFSGVLLSELFSFLAAYAILRSLARCSTFFSPTTYRMHHQLTVLLVTQLATPLIFIITPVVAALLAILLHVPLSQTTGRVGFLLLALYPLCNVSLTLLFITPYRTFTVLSVRKGYRSIVPVSDRRIAEGGVHTGERKPSGGNVHTTAVSSAIFEVERYQHRVSVSAR